MAHNNSHRDIVCVDVYTLKYNMFDWFSTITKIHAMCASGVNQNIHIRIFYMQLHTFLQILLIRLWKTRHYTLSVRSYCPTTIDDAFQDMSK